MSAFLVFLIAACASAGSSSELPAAAASGGAGAASNSSFGGSDTNDDFVDGSGGGGEPSAAVAFVSGTVLAPEGTIPISGALVYATKDTVEPIPQTVFCDRCVDLAPTAAYTFTVADGSFSLGVIGAGSWTIVMQKGSFRRVQTVQVEADADQVLEAAATTMPSERNVATGDEIPKMAVATVQTGNWDNIGNSLAKLGLGELDAFGELVPGTESFHLYGPNSAYGDSSALLTDYATLAQYHVVFFPCAVDWPDTYLTDPQVIENLRTFMLAGGRVYATDYSYDILKRAFAEPIQWLYDDGAFGAAETSEYDAPATVVDNDMAAWLAAQGVTSFSLEANFTIVDSVEQYEAPDEDGNVSTMMPTVWVEGAVPGQGNRPATISYQYGCGRALFSTYHTEPWGLQSPLPQERALLYTILEVGVCIGDLPPPK